MSVSVEFWRESERRKGKTNSIPEDKISHFNTQTLTIISKLLYCGTFLFELYNHRGK